MRQRAAGLVLGGAGLLGVGLWLAGQAWAEMAMSPAAAAWPTLSSPPAASLGEPTPAAAAHLAGATASPAAAWPVIPPAELTPAPSVEPPRLLIPAHGVDVAVAPVPIKDGEWDLSQLGMQAGRLTTLGERPGAALAVVLIGHVSQSNGLEGPFSSLWKLKAGTAIIYRLAGVDYTYAVEDKLNVAPAEIKSLYVPDGNWLVLVTCTDWDAQTRRYLQRLMVRARRIE